MEKVTEQYLQQFPPHSECGTKMELKEPDGTRRIAIPGKNQYLTFSQGLYYCPKCKEYVSVQ